jgi:hypothetical protein
VAGEIQDLVILQCGKVRVHLTDHARGDSAVVSLDVLGKAVREVRSTVTVADEQDAFGIPEV